MTHHINRKLYLKVFLALIALTVLEVAVVEFPGINPTLAVTGLFSLSFVKAFLVAAIFMHLRDESKIMRYSMALPMAVPAVYAIVLIGEASWRLLP